MILQDWMVVVAGQKLMEDLSAETKTRCQRKFDGYSSTDLCALQREQAARGIVGVEIVTSNYGCSVRYDSGLQNFGLIASARRNEVNGTLADAERWCREWVAVDPARRYAWRRAARGPVHE